MDMSYTISLDQCVDRFFQYLSEERSLSKNTLDSYIRDIKQYIGYVNDTNTQSSWNERITVNNYLRSLQKRGRAATTIHRTLVSLRTFYQYLARNR